MISSGPPPTIASGQSGRLQLALWIASSRNPLPARVMVHRVWRHLFGSGLVLTTDYFGVMGDRPSHPELLDYLAVEFMEEGWSIKSTIRRIMQEEEVRVKSEPKTVQDRLEMLTDFVERCQAEERG